MIKMSRYYAVTRSFACENPFNSWSTKRILIIVWCLSAVLTLPYFLTVHVDYFDYNTTEVICIIDQQFINNSNIIVAIYTSTVADFYNILSVLLEFIIPTIFVSLFSMLIIFHLFRVYKNSIRGIQMTFHINRCEITKRLLTVLLVFILKNMAYFITTYGLEPTYWDSQSLCPFQEHYFICYEIFRLTTLLNSIIYFWLNSKFRNDFIKLISSCNLRSRSAS